jgi:hypothetical protein
MSAPVKVVTLPEVPAEVLSFAAEKGVNDYLYPVLEMTARIFAGCPLQVFIEYDPEDPDWQSIVMQAGTVGWSSERIAAGMSRWSREVVAYCPNSHTRYFVCTFV